MDMYEEHRRVIREQDELIFNLRVEINNLEQELDYLRDKLYDYEYDTKYDYVGER